MTYSRIGRALLFGLILAAPCGAQGRLNLTEFPVGGYPGGIVGGPDGAAWFTLVLDGCVLNERYWLFAAGLTDVGVYTVVTDTRSGVVRTYENQLHTPFAAITDTNAFDVCP